jgi:hypothetical protein
MGLGSRIRKKPMPDLGSMFERAPDPGYRSATLVENIVYLSCIGQLASDQKTEGLKDANSIWLKTAEDTMRGVDTKKLEKEQQLRQKKQDKKV